MSKDRNGTESKGFKAHAADARDWVNSALDEAGRPFIPVASAWKQAADARAELRTEENLSALMDANREHRDAMRDLRRDRRAFEKARDEVKWWNVFNGERRAAFRTSSHPVPLSPSPASRRS